MKIACCIWALRPPETDRLHQISQKGKMRESSIQWSSQIACLTYNHLVPKRAMTYDGLTYLY